MKCNLKNIANSLQICLDLKENKKYNLKIISYAIAAAFISTGVSLVPFL
jgi:hypothetical protein